MKGYHAGSDDSVEGKKANKLITDHGLTLAEATAIGLYTSSDYRYMTPSFNKDSNWMRQALKDPLLRVKDPENWTQLRERITDQHVDKAMEEGQLHSKMALKGLAKLPDWEGEVYRGVAFTPTNFVAKYDVNKATVFPAFSSCSRDKEPSKEFAKTNAKGGRIPILLRIHVNKGKNVRKLSSNRHEKEILLLPGSTFSVTSISDDTDGAKLVDMLQTK